jgi:ribonuclease P protein component
MLSKPYRLPALVYDQVKTKGELIKIPGLALLKLKKSDQSQSRLGIIVSTKISKSAVRRNLLKRQLRHALRDNLDQFPNSLDLIFLPSKQLLNVSFEELKQKVKNLIMKIEN